MTSPARSEWCGRATAVGNNLSVRVVYHRRPSLSMLQSIASRTIVREGRGSTRGTDLRIPIRRSRADIEPSNAGAAPTERDAHELVRPFMERLRIQSIRFRFRILWLLFATLGVGLLSDVLQAEEPNRPPASVTLEFEPEG